MSTQRYSVTPHPIETLLTWVKSGEIAIPEIQRPFVWEATKVRNLLDSLYQGYPVGYLIAWRNPTVKLKDKGFLSRDITVHDLLLNHSDVHHVYPKKYLKSQGLSRGRYNQISNFVLAQSEINIAIGYKAPQIYFAELAEQCNGGKKKYGGITDINELRENLRMSCLPVQLLDGEIPAYDEFLEQRRKLMAQKIKLWFESL